MAYKRCKASLLVLSLYLCTSPAAAWRARCKTSDIAGYSCRVNPASGLVVYYGVDDGELAVRLEYSNQMWLGWAVSKTGIMADGDAVIIAPATSSVQRYRLMNHFVGSPRTVQDLVETQVSLSDNSAKLVAEFRRKLEATGTDGVEVVNGDNIFLFAIGKTRAFDTATSAHATRGMYTLDLSAAFSAAAPTPAPDGTPTPAPVAPETPPPTPAPSSGAVVTAGDCLSSTDAAYQYGVALESGYKMWWAVDDAAGTLSAKLEYSGEAWVGWGPSPDGLMLGSSVVIGLPGQEGGVYEYYLDAKLLSGVTRAQTQELTQTSVTQAGGVTTVEFTRPLQPKEPGKLPTPANGAFHAVYAYGVVNVLSQHSPTAAHGLVLDLGSCGVEYTSPTYTLRDVHGWLMAASFGFLLPLGAIAARFGRRLEKGWWFIAHRMVQTLGLLGGLAGIGVGVAMVDKDYGGQHLQKNHNKYGVAIGCLVVLQVALAVLRPHKKDAGSAAIAEAMAAAPIATALDYNDEIGQEAKSSVAVTERYKTDSRSPTRQSKTRVAWEWFHFAVGWGVVVCSVLQVYGGLRLIEGEVSGSYTWGYTGVVAGLAAIAVMLQLVVALRKRTSHRQ